MFKFNTFKINKSILYNTWLRFDQRDPSVNQGKRNLFSKAISACMDIWWSARCLKHYVRLIFFGNDKKENAYVIAASGVCLFGFQITCSVLMNSNVVVHANLIKKRTNCPKADSCIFEKKQFSFDWANIGIDTSKTFVYIMVYIFSLSKSHELQCPLQINCKSATSSTNFTSWKRDWALVINNRKC